MLSWRQLRPNPDSKHKDRHNPVVTVGGVKYRVCEWSEKAVKAVSDDGRVKYISKKDYAELQRLSHVR